MNRQIGSETVSEYEDDSESYLTSSPAKSKTLVMVTLAGCGSFVSVLEGATFVAEESAWGFKKKNQLEKKKELRDTQRTGLGCILNHIWHQWCLKSGAHGLGSFRGLEGAL